MPNLQLIIFDCDGVLIDSEYLSAQINSELLTEAGYAISAEELSERYSGMIFSDTLKIIEKEADIPFSASLIDKAQSEYAKRLKSELMPIDGVRDAVEKLNLPYCICSNSVSANIKQALSLTGLDDLFEDRIFSAPEVGTKKSKPAPDVFLFAAKSFQVEPQNVIVIEDSVTGITAAKAAGMRVIGFTGGSHAYRGLGDILTEAGAETVVTRHKDVPAVIDALAEWRDS